MLQDLPSPSHHDAADEPIARRGALRVLVASDDALARTALAMILGRESELGAQFVVVKRVPIEQIGDALAQEGAELVVCDLGADPQRAHALVLTLQLDVPLVVLVPEGVSAAQALAAGALGVLPRTVDADALLRAVLAAAGGLMVLDAALGASLGRAPQPRGARVRSMAQAALTPREREVLQTLAEGLANKDIGRRLHISEHTVKFHINAILGKLGADSRTDAVVQAARLGLVML